VRKCLIDMSVRAIRSPNPVASLDNKLYQEHESYNQFKRNDTISQFDLRRNDAVRAQGTIREFTSHINPPNL